jgi:hypothetical protein
MPENERTAFRRYRKAVQRRQGRLAVMTAGQGNGTAKEAGAWVAAEADAEHQQRQASLPGADDGGQAWMLDQAFE